MKLLQKSYGALIVMVCYFGYCSGMYNELWGEQYPQKVGAVVKRVEQGLEQAIILTQPFSNDYAVGPMEALITEEKNTPLVARIISLLNKSGISYCYIMPLYYACFCNNKSGVELLLKHGAQSCWTAQKTWHHFSLNALVTSILPDNFDATYFNPERIQTVLAIAKLLITHGAPTDWYTVDGKTNLSLLVDSYLNKRKSMLIQYDHAPRLSKLFKFVKKKESNQLILHKKLIALFLHAGADPYLKPFPESVSSYVRAFKSVQRPLIDFLEKEPLHHHTNLIAILSRGTKAIPTAGCGPLSPELAWLIADMVYPSVAKKRVVLK